MEKETNEVSKSSHIDDETKIKARGRIDLREERKSRAEDKTETVMKAFTVKREGKH